MKTQNSQTKVEQLKQRETFVKPLSKSKRIALISIVFICFSGALVLQTMDQNIFVDKISVALFIISCLLVAHINSHPAK